MTTACERCPHREPCGDSRWNEYGGGNPKADYISMVHRCFTCGNRAFTLYADIAAEKGQVPETCPRFGENFGSALDCGACNDERVGIRERHPMWDTHRKASNTLWEGFKKLVSVGDELAIHRAVKESAALWSQAVMPFSSYQDQVDEEDLHRALRIMGSLGEDENLLDFPENVAEVTASEPERMNLETIRWTETVYLAIRHHGPDPDAIRREFRLTYTSGIGRHVWSTRSLEKRVEMYDKWRHLIEKGLGVAEVDIRRFNMKAVPDPEEP